MIRNLIIAILLCSPLFCQAQSEWETPNAVKPKTEKPKKADKEEAKKEAVRDIKDWKYIQEGAVPEVDGKVVFSSDIDLPSMTAEEIYDKTYAVLDTLAHSENQIQSGIAIVNRKQHIIAARYTEWLEFSSSFLSVDRTKFNYTIIAKCADGKLHVTLERISYSYDEGRPSAMHTTADKWINDKNAVNKKRTKLLIGPAKFRRKTIDRKDQIFTFIKEALTTK